MVCIIYSVIDWSVFTILVWMVVLLATISDRENNIERNATTGQIILCGGGGGNGGGDYSSYGPLGNDALNQIFFDSQYNRECNGGR